MIGSVREFLEQRGCPDFVVEGGLAGLLANWDRLAEQLEAGYTLGLDDYLNELDARQLLDDALPFATDDERRSVRARLSLADARVRQLTRPIGRCLWGDKIASMSGWDPARNWWFFAIPVDPGPELSADLKHDLLPSPTSN